MSDSPHPSRDTDFQYVAQILVPDALVEGRYRLIEPLGRGGYSIVWRARDEHLNMDVAIKFLSDLIVNNPEALRDLKRETRLSLKLTHPNIVRIYGFLQEQHVAGISMELVDGGTLSDRKAALEAGAFQPEELEPMLRPLCEALTYAHDVIEVVHHDLKPANLMVDGRGNLRITDFGISSSLNDTRTRDTAQVSGTVAYMSPQQIAGRRASVTDDVYSLGATLFDLLAGKPPFYKGNVLGQVVSAEPPSIQERREELGIALDPVPAEWEETIRACLAKEAEARPQTIREVAERLGVADVTSTGRMAPYPPGGGKPEAASGGSARAGLAGLKRIGPVPILGGLAAAVVVGVLAVWFATRDGSARDAAPGIASRTPATETRAAPDPKGAGELPATGGMENGNDAGTERDANDTDAVVPPEGDERSDGGNGNAGAVDVRSDEGNADDAGVNPASVSDAGMAAGSNPAGTRSIDAGPDVDGMRAGIETMIAARQWEDAMAGIENLVDAAPGEIALAHRLTQALSEGKENELRENRIAALRDDVRGQVARGNWTAAGAGIDELDRLVPGDPEVSAWKARRDEALAAARAASAPASETTTAGRADSEPANTTSPAGEEAAIRAVLQNYEAAMEALDVGRYASLWASLPGSERSKIDRAFRDLKGQDLEISGTKIALDGESATVRFQQKQTIHMIVGSDPPAVDRSRTMKLVRSADGRWLIDSIQ